MKITSRAVVGGKLVVKASQGSLEIEVNDETQAQYVEMLVELEVRLARESWQRKMRDLLGIEAE